MMKNIILLILIGCVLLISGCQENNKKESAKIEKFVEVTLEGTDTFPEFLVGRWFGDVDGWELEFDNRGELLYAIIPLVKNKIYPGKITKVPLQFNGEVIYESGKWTVGYSKTINELTVEINIDYFKIQSADDIFEGSVKEQLVGKLSKDKKVLWRSNWIRSQIYIISTPEKRDIVLETGSNDSPVKKVLFTKISD